MFGNEINIQSYLRQIRQKYAKVHENCLQKTQRTSIQQTETLNLPFLNLSQLGSKLSNHSLQMSNSDRTKTHQRQLSNQLVFQLISKENIQLSNALERERLEHSQKIEEAVYEIFTMSNFLQQKAEQVRTLTKINDSLSESLNASSKKLDTPEGLSLTSFSQKGRQSEKQSQDHISKSSKTLRDLQNLSRQGNSEQDSDSQKQYQGKQILNYSEYAITVKGIDQSEQNKAPLAWMLQTQSKLLENKENISSELSFDLITSPSFLNTNSNIKTPADLSLSTSIRAMIDSNMNSSAQSGIERSEVIQEETHEQESSRSSTQSKQIQETSSPETSQYVFVTQSQGFAQTQAFDSFASAKGFNEYYFEIMNTVTKLSSQCLEKQGNEAKLIANLNACEDRISQLIQRHKRTSKIKSESGRPIVKSVSFKDVQPDSQATSCG